MTSYDTSKGQLPGYMQFVKRSQTVMADISHAPAVQRFVVISTEFDPNDPKSLYQVSGFSWATMLLSRLERADIWDQIVQPPLSDEPLPVEIPVMEVFVCPSDQDVASQADLAGISYNTNSGAWDLNQSGKFLFGPKIGDTSANGLLFDLE
jgi:hypothetical protein